MFEVTVIRTEHPSKAQWREKLLVNVPAAEYVGRAVLASYAAENITISFRAVKRVPAGAVFLLSSQKVSE